jgi:hypothetical protein
MAVSDRPPFFMAFPLSRAIPGAHEYESFSASSQPAQSYSEPGAHTDQRVGLLPPRRVQPNPLCGYFDDDVRHAREVLEDLLEVCAEDLGCVGWLAP